MQFIFYVGHSFLITASLFFNGSFCYEDQIYLLTSNFYESQLF